MKLMKFFLIGALALSTIAPSLSGMEAINRYLNSAPHEEPATAQEIENAQDCNICQEGLNNGQAIRALRCNPAGVPHIYHRQCINNWLLRQARCPTCQHPAQPTLSRKEYLIEKTKLLEHNHNPFNQNNRKATICAASLHAIAAVIVILGKSLIVKYYFPNSDKEILKDIINQYFSIGIYKDKFETINIFNAIDFLITYLRFQRGTELEIQDILANKRLWLELATLKLLSQLGLLIQPF